MTTVDELHAGFGERLRRYRALAGLNQASLARTLSVDRSLVSRWESGSREPSLWEVVRAAGALGVSVSALVVGSQGLLGGSEVVWQELACRGVPLLAAAEVPLWSVRPVHETVADALLHPEPRVIDLLPGVLLLEEVSPRALWGQCADLGVERRLGWIADVALGLAREGRIATQASRSRVLQTALSLVARPENDVEYDSLGFEAAELRTLSPVFRRWRISYDGELRRFEAAAKELEEAHRRRAVR